MRNIKKILMNTILGVACAIILGLSFWDQADETSVAHTVALLFASAVLVGYFVRLFLKHRREQTEQRIRQTSQEITDADERSPILYLRPFRVDNTRIPTTHYDGKPYYSIESLLCAFMKDHGSPVAIGKPHEKLQPLGAKRMYADDHAWQGVVLEYLEKSRFVLLYIDFTPGVRWEIHNALEKYMDKLILVPKIYNVKTDFWGYTFMTDVIVLLYPIFWLVNHPFIFKRTRRGGQFYRDWRKETEDILGTTTIDDRVSAVIFQDGKPVLFKAKSATLQAQMAAILNAVKEKTKWEA